MEPTTVLSDENFRCNIFVRSPKSANRVMAGISKFIEQQRKLKINRGGRVNIT
jgi:hypothetical protein